MDHRFDVFRDILLLSAFVVKGHRTKCDVLKGFPDVDLRATSHADTKTRKAETDEFLNDLKDLFANGRDPSGIGTFVKSIHDEINWTLIGKGEHLLQAVHQSGVTGLTRAFAIFLIKPREYVAEGIGGSSKLDEK